MLFTSTMPTHAEKNRGRRVLFPLKRANTAPFGLCDRARMYQAYTKDLRRTRHIQKTQDVPGTYKRPWVMDNQAQKKI
jgi:hypothetical protein